MSKSLLDNLLDSSFDADWVGKRGEKLTERELKLVNLFGRRGKILRNVYIPKDNGETSEIDVIYVTQKGIFVFESQHYSGWIFGDEDSQYWTVMLPNKQKNRFYNPIRQNRTHVKWLGTFIDSGIPLFSIIVFSERCELKKISVESSDVRVIKRDRTYAAVRSIWETVPDVLSEEVVDDLYQRLKPLTEVEEAVKLAHVESIRTKYPKEHAARKPETAKPETETPSSSVPGTCPRCGKALVLRTAKSGPHAGKRFYGCSGFPGCRYTESLPETPAQTE